MRSKLTGSIPNSIVVAGDEDLSQEGCHAGPDLPARFVFEVCVALVSLIWDLRPKSSYGNVQLRGVDLFTMFPAYRASMQTHAIPQRVLILERQSLFVSTDFR